MHPKKIHPKLVVPDQISSDFLNLLNQCLPFKNLVSFSSFNHFGFTHESVRFRTSRIQAVANLEVKEQITFEKSRVLAPKPAQITVPIQSEIPIFDIDRHHLCQVPGTGLQR